MRSQCLVDRQFHERRAVAIPEPNTALGASYRLERRIGRGAAGEVWSAIDLRSGEQVAAKLLHAEHAGDHNLVARFVTERTILTGLHHPSIVTVRDLVVEGDHLAIVMDYLDGGSVRQLLENVRTLAPASAAGLVKLALDGIAAAHEAGVLHRDIKPDNVLLTKQWPNLQRGDVRITDFGIARLIDDGPRSTTGLIGTPQYMSPELFTTGQCSYPADVYGAGILLYELLAGRTPFAGAGTDFTVAHRHVSARPPRLGVPDELWTLLERLLHKDPAARPPAAEAATALARISSGLAGLPALEPVAAPHAFDEEHPQATIIRDPAHTEVTSGPETRLSPAPELGLAPQHTILRPSLRPVAPPQPSRPKAPEAQPADLRPPWRNPKMLALAISALAVATGAAFFAVKAHAPATPAAASAAVKATQQDRPTPTGLTIARNAEYDPQAHKVHLTITYSAQNAPLTGPFLEVLPGTDGADCPGVDWPEAPQQRNLPTATGISTACSWSLQTGVIAPQQSQTVTASLTLPDALEASSDALQQWLDAAAAATTAATSDGQVTSTSYPVQRLQSVEVQAPDRTVTGKQLPLTLFPVWPSGPDHLNPLYRSPAVGSATSMLVSIAGGGGGVRFSDGCSGGVVVSEDGHDVTTLSVTPSCVINARVGNFSDLSSNEFSIISRG